MQRLVFGLMSRLGWGGSGVVVVLAAQQPGEVRISAHVYNGGVEAAARQNGAVVVKVRSLRNWSWQAAPAAAMAAKRGAEDTVENMGSLLAAGNEQ